MRVVYISPYNVGSTSRMRGQYLQEILDAEEFKIIDTSIPLGATPRLLRTLGWRFKVGPLIDNFRDFILEKLDGRFDYDLVWIDKGVFIRPEIVQKLRDQSRILVHYTPDPAFTYHRSKLFYKALPLYDYCITTKSFELENYRSYGVKTIFCTQGYDPAVHHPMHSFEEKKGVAFIGHREKNREEAIAALLDAGIETTIAGNSWERFAHSRRKDANLHYRGKGLFGADYVNALSAAQVGLGFLSTWIPELHTTRTIEIPACGTALATENNAETSSIFAPGEAIFYKDLPDMVEKLGWFLNNKNALREVSVRGMAKITGGPFSYYEIVKNIVNQILK